MTAAHSTPQPAFACEPPIPDIVLHRLTRPPTYYRTENGALVVRTCWFSTPRGETDCDISVWREPAP